MRGVLGLEFSTAYVGMPLVRREREKDLTMLRIPVAVGRPMGQAGAISDGIVQAVPAGKLIEADIHPAPGKSGRPLADVTGRVIGINRMAVNPTGISVSGVCVAEFLQGNRETGWDNG